MAGKAWFEAKKEKRKKFRSLILRDSYLIQTFYSHFASYCVSKNTIFVARSLLGSNLQYSQGHCFLSAHFLGKLTLSLLMPLSQCFWEELFMTLDRGSTVDHRPCSLLCEPPDLSPAVALPNPNSLSSLWRLIYPEFIATCCLSVCSLAGSQQPSAIQSLLLLLLPPSVNTAFTLAKTSLLYLVIQYEAIQSCHKSKVYDCIIPAQ